MNTVRREEDNMFRDLTKIQTDSPELRRRGELLIKIGVGLSIITVLTVVIFSIFPLTPDHSIGLALLSGAFAIAFYQGCIWIARRGWVNQAGLLIGLNIDASIFLWTLSNGELQTWLFSLIFAPLLVALVSDRRWVPPLVVMNLIGTYWVVHELPYMNGLETPPDLLSGLLNMQLVTGVLAWVIGRETSQAFHEVLEAKEELTDARAREQTAREEAEAANHAKSRFLANMSHELRTPLNAVIGYAEIIQEELLDEGRHTDDPLLNDTLRIQQAGQHLLSMISDVLDLSKIEADHMELVTGELVLATFVDELTETVHPLILKRSNRFAAHIDTTSPVLITDEMRLRQILLNLISNAAKFTKDGDITLHIEADPTSSQHMLFHVSDTGIGMTHEELDRVFEAFSQADESTTRLYGGTGLGLALCTRLSELLGGSISATSTPGEGTTFTLKLDAHLDSNVAATGAAA